MTDARKHSRVSIVLLAVFLSLLSFLAAAQEKKEFSYTVGPGAVIFLTNNYGPISVKPLEPVRWWSRRYPIPIRSTW
jgi:hypothetical protein